MGIRKAARRLAILSASGIPALLLLGPAFASTDIQDPCPELTKHAETSLHAILDNDGVMSPAIRTIDSSETISPAPVADTAARTHVEDNEAAVDTDETGNRSAAMPTISTRLPGVASSDVPRFRRHMFRTDI